MKALLDFSTFLSSRFRSLFEGTVLIYLPIGQHVTNDRQWSWAWYTQPLEESYPLVCAPEQERESKEQQSSPSHSRFSFIRMRLHSRLN